MPNSPLLDAPGDTPLAVKPETAQRLLLMLEAFERGDFAAQPRAKLVAPQWHLQRIFIAKTDSAIAARSGTTVSSGTVTLYFINDSNALEVLQAANSDGDLENVTKTAWNVSAAAVTADTYIVIALDSSRTQKWLVIVESCEV